MGGDMMISTFLLLRLQYTVKDGQTNVGIKRSLIQKI